MCTHYPLAAKLEEQRFLKVMNIQKKKRRHNTQGQMSSYVALDLAYQESTTLFVDSREKKEAS